MRGSNAEAFKQGFLKNLILSLGAIRRGAASSGTVHERKRAIKRSADVAMATTRGAGARWPRTLLASSSSPSRQVPAPCEDQRRKTIAKRCRRRRRNGGAGGSPSRAALVRRSREVARRLVRARTKVLRSVIPGGELLVDEVTLLREAMDYVAHLHAQVDVLRRIAKAVG